MDDGELKADRPVWRTQRPVGRWGRPTSPKEIWAYRELAGQLALRDLRLRYRQTLFGVSWALLQPAALVVVFSLVFGRLADVPSDGLPYPVFALTGLVVWSFVASAVTAAADSLIEHRALVTEVWIPRILAPTASVLGVLIDLLVGLVLVFPILLLYGIDLPVQVLTLPLWMMGAIFVGIGAGLWLSAANVLYRDVRYTLGYILQLWLFISPVAFPSSLVEGTWQYVYALNPMVGILDGARWALVDGPAPGPELVVSAASLATLVGGGILYFQVTERAFSDRI